MISNEKIAALAEEQARIDAARAAFLAQGGRVQVLASYEFKPEPPRKAWVDPETVLKRRKPQLSRSDRLALRQLAAQL